MTFNYLISVLSVLLMLHECSSWIRFRMPPSRRNYLDQTPREKLQNCGGNLEDCGVCGEGIGEVQTYTIPPERYTVVDPSQRLLGVVVGFRSDLHGYVEFRICAISDNYTTDAITCNKTTPLLIGQESKWSPAHGQNFADSRFRLPPDLVCERCVLQVKYTPGNDSSMKAFRFYDCALLNITKLNEELPVDHFAELSITSTSSDRQNQSSTSTDRQNQISPSSDRQNQSSTSSDRQNQISTSSDRQNQSSTSSDRQNQSSPSSDRQNQSSTSSDRQNQSSTSSDRQNQSSTPSDPQNQSHNEQITQMYSERIPNKARKVDSIAGSNASENSSNSQTDSETRGGLGTIKSKPFEVQSLPSMMFPPDHGSLDRLNIIAEVTTSGELDNSVDILQAIRSSFNFSRNKSELSTGQRGNINTSEEELRKDSKVRSEVNKSVNTSITNNTTQGEIPVQKDTPSMGDQRISVNTGIAKGDPILSIGDQGVSITKIEVTDYNNVTSEKKNEDRSKLNITHNIDEAIENTNSMTGKVFEASTGNSLNQTTRNVISNNSISNNITEDSMSGIFVTRKYSIEVFNASVEQFYRSGTNFTDFDMGISVKSSAIGEQIITIPKENNSVHNMSRKENAFNNITKEIAGNGTNLYDNEAIWETRNNDSFSYYDDFYYYDYNTSVTENETYSGTESILNHTMHPEEANKKYFASKSVTDTTQPSLLSDVNNIILNKNVDTSNTTTDSFMTKLSDNADYNNIESRSLGDVLNDTGITIGKVFNRTMDEIGLRYEHFDNNTSNLSTLTNNSESGRNANGIVQTIVKVSNDLIVQLNQSNEDKNVVVSREPVRLSINRWEVLNNSESDTTWKDPITGWADNSDNIATSPQYVSLNNTDISSWTDIRQNKLVSESTMIHSNSDAGNLETNVIENKLIEYADQTPIVANLASNSQETVITNLEIESNRTVNKSLHGNSVLREYVSLNNTDLKKEDVPTEWMSNKINITSLNNDTVFLPTATQVPEVKKTSLPFVPTSYFKSAQDFITKAYENFRDNTPAPPDMQIITTDISQTGQDVNTRAYDPYVGIPPTTISLTDLPETNFIQLLNLSSESVAETMFPELKQDISSSSNMVVNITSLPHKANTELSSLFSTTVSPISHKQSKGSIPHIQSKVNIPHKKLTGNVGTMKHNETAIDYSLFSAESSNFLKDHDVTVDQLGGIPVSQSDDVINWKIQINKKSQDTNLVKTLNTIMSKSSASMDAINTSNTDVNSIGYLNRTFFKWNKPEYTYFVVPLSTRNSSYSISSKTDSKSNASTISLMDTTDVNIKHVDAERNGQHKDHRTAGTRFVGRIGQTIEDTYANLKFVENENSVTETGNSFNTITEKVESRVLPEIQSRVIWAAMHLITSSPNITISTNEEETHKGNTVHTIVKNIERLTKGNAESTNNSINTNIERLTKGNAESSNNSINTRIERLTKGNAKSTNNSIDTNIDRLAYATKDSHFNAFDTQNIKLLDSMDITVNGDAVLNKISKMKLNSVLANHETGAFETPKQMPAIIANGAPSIDRNKVKNNQDHKYIELIHPTFSNVRESDMPTNVNIGEKNKSTNLNETILWDINRLIKTGRKSTSSKEVANHDTLPVGHVKGRTELFEVNPVLLHNDGIIGDKMSSKNTQENEWNRTLPNNENGNTIVQLLEVGTNVLQPTKPLDVLKQDQNTAANNIASTDVKNSNVSRTLQALALELEAFTKKNGNIQNKKLPTEGKDIKDTKSVINSTVSNTENIKGNYLVKTGATYRPYPNFQDSNAEHRVADLKRVGGFHSNTTDTNNSLRGSQFHKMMNLQGQVGQKDWTPTSFFNTDFKSSGIRDFSNTSKQGLNQAIISVTGASEGNSDLISTFTDSFSNSSNVKITQNNENMGKLTKKEINKTARSNTIEQIPEILVNASALQQTVVSDSSDEATSRTQTLINSTGESSDRHFAESGIMFLPNTREQGHDKFIARGIGNLRHVYSVEQTDRNMFPVGAQAEQYHLFHKLPTNNLISIEGKYFVGQMRRNKFGQFEPVPLASDLALFSNGMQESNLYLDTAGSSYIDNVASEPLSTKKEHGIVQPTFKNISTIRTEQQTLTDIIPTITIENESYLKQLRGIGHQTDAKQNIFSNDNKGAFVSKPEHVSNVNSIGSEQESRQYFYSQPELLRKLGISEEETNDSLTINDDRSVKVSESNKNHIQSKEYIGQCAANELFICRASGLNQFIPGMVWWCFQECRNNRSCPIDLCDCKCRNVTIKPTTTIAEQTKQPVITRSKEIESNVPKRRKTVINLTLNGSVQAKIPVINLPDRASDTLTNRKIIEIINDKATNTIQRAITRTSQHDLTNTLNN